MGAFVIAFAACPVNTADCDDEVTDCPYVLGIFDIGILVVVLIVQDDGLDGGKIIAAELNVRSLFKIGRVKTAAFQIEQGTGAEQERQKDRKKWQSPDKASLVLGHRYPS